MAFFNCRCGCRVDLSEVPNDKVYRFMSDEAYHRKINAFEKLARRILRRKESRGSGASDTLFYDMVRTMKKGMKEFVICPDCGRIAVFWSKHAVGVSYSKDEP
jgi:hypothetical protein